MTIYTVESATLGVQMETAADAHDASALDWLREEQQRVPGTAIAAEPAGHERTLAASSDDVVSRVPIAPRHDATTNEPVDTRARLRPLAPSSDVDTSATRCASGLKTKKRKPTQVLRKVLSKWALACLL